MFKNNRALALRNSTLHQKSSTASLGHVSASENRDDRFSVGAGDTYHGRGSEQLDGANIDH